MTSVSCEMSGGSTADACSLRNAAVAAAASMILLMGSGCKDSLTPIVDGEVDAKGVKVYVDPESGELRETPAPGTEVPAEGDVLQPGEGVDLKRPVQGGLRVYIDPETGEFLDAPPPGAELPALQVPSAPSEVPQEVPAPGGGLMIELGEPEMEY